MTFDARRTDYSRQHINIVEIDLDYCTRTWGEGGAGCTASGEFKCFNTLDSCQVIPKYNKTTQTYRFCTNVSPHPLELDAIPSLDSVSLSPSKIDLKGGLGVRASVSLSFKDHPSSDIGIDPYLDSRSYIAFERGTYWTKLRARNPNYQNRELRVLSGYLVNGVYDAANFETRYYIIDKMDVTGGMAKITGKDPLKLASKNKAQAPAPSTGQLLADISAASASATLIPAGVGSQEYEASGKVLIGSEVIAFTRVADILTLTRAQNNTVAVAHSANDTVQQCLEYNLQVNEIVEDLLTTYAGIDASFIDTSSWQTEVDTFLSGLLDGIIVKPFDVWKLLKELSESMPHYLWWNEKTQKIELTALKAPPTSANLLTMDQNLIKNSFRTQDKPDMRVSTVFINFGQFDPTKKLDEPSNYQQTYARIDTDSISKYGSSEVQTINSRWISNLNKAAAFQLGALIGRRFSNVPRQLRFSLDAKDSDVWIGQSRAIQHRDITDFTGAAESDNIYQITSVRERGNYDYEALEFTYGDSLPDDEGGGEPGVDVIVIGTNLQDQNLRTIYDSLFSTPDGSTKAKFYIESGVILGSSSTSTSAVDTGSFPLGAEITIQLVSGSYLVGKGGVGGDGTPTAGGDGGVALELNHPVTIDNSGRIGGGGGGGGGGQLTSGGNGKLSGGGGAGNSIGSTGVVTNYTGAGEIIDLTFAAKGTTMTGGQGGTMTWETAGELFDIVSGKGGNLGSAGTAATSAGGLGGGAIVTNGHAITYIKAGTISGSIV